MSEILSFETHCSICFSLCVCCATENGFTATQISHLLGVSTRTVERRIQQWDIHSDFSQVSDNELDAFLSPLVGANPTLGLLSTCFLLHFIDRLYVQILCSLYALLIFRFPVRFDIVMHSTLTLREYTRTS